MNYYSNSYVYWFYLTNYKNYFFKKVKKLVLIGYWANEREKAGFF